MLVFVVDLARRHQIQPDSFCSAILGPKHFRSDTSETAMAKSLLIPAILTGAAAFVAPTANLHATAAPGAPHPKGDHGGHACGESKGGEVENHGEDRAGWGFKGTFG